MGYGGEKTQIQLMYICLQNLGSRRKVLIFFTICIISFCMSLHSQVLELVVQCSKGDKQEHPPQIIISNAPSKNASRKMHQAKCNKQKYSKKNAPSKIAFAMDVFEKTRAMTRINRLYLLQLISCCFFCRVPYSSSRRPPSSFPLCKKSLTFSKPKYIQAGPSICVGLN